MILICYGEIRVILLCKFSNRIFTEKIRGGFGLCSFFHCLLPTFHVMTERAPGSVGERDWDRLPNLHLACLHNRHVTIHIHCEAIYYSIYQKHMPYFHTHSLNTVKNPVTSAFV